jgi:ABC-2 type transport system permease protein
MNNMLAVIERDLQNFLKYKYWIGVLLLTNIADLLIMAANFSNLVTFGAGTFNYLLFFAPGLAVLSLFGATFIMGIEVSGERQSQQIYYLLSLPIDRFQFTVARAFAGAIRSMVFCIPLLIIAFVMLGVPSFLTVLLIIFCLFTLAIGLTSLSIALATAIMSTRRYQLARGIVSMYLMFASTVFYPYQAGGVPILAQIPILNVVAELNPLSYGANLLRSLLDPVQYGEVQLLDVLGLIGFTIIMVYLGLFFYNRFTRIA